MTLLVHVFDFFILIKYYSTFLGERRLGSRLFFWGYSIGFILLGIFVNLIEYSILNFLLSCSCVWLTGLWYRGKIGIKICYFFIYLGISAIAEVITILILSNMLENFSILEISFAMAICQGIKYSIIMLFCTFKTEKSENLPKGTTLIMSIIFMGAALGCILINYNFVLNTYTISLLSMLVIVITFLLIFILVFTLLDRFSRAVRLNYEQSLIIQESYLKESYYREIDENNLQLRKIKHDIKNKLLAFSSLNGDDIGAAQEMMASIFEEINELEGKIYSKNNAVNAICKVKFANAKKRNIKVNYEINLPEYININYGDLGILYGNLLDNAIEACEEIKEELRYINLKTSLYNENLLLIIENSKKFNIFLDEKYYTTKSDRKNHGFGITSVKEVVEKYHGVINISCEAQIFSVEILLYGILVMPHINI